MSTAGTTSNAEPQQPAPQEEKKSRTKLIVGVVAAVVVIAAAIGGVLVLTADDAGADEIQLEAFDSTGENPFTESVGDGVPVEPAEVPPTDQDAVQFTGETVGLYGGTEDAGRCDPAQLVTFLQQNPDKAAAWAEVHGITPDQIPQFVSTLTPMILRSDTAVTNHSYADGRATPLQSILQAGTAVLVNDKGEPVVKCSCGNPLLAPEWSGTREFKGTPWPDFNERTIVIIQRSATTINNFQVFNLTTNQIVQVPAGSANIPGTPGTPATPTTTPTSPTTTAAPSASPVDGRYNLVITNTVCEINGGTCPPSETVPIEVTCSGSSCDIGGDPYTLSGSTLTSNEYSGPSCDGVEVAGGSSTTTLTIDASGNISGGRTTTAPAVPPNCPSPFREVWEYSGGRA